MSPEPTPPNPVHRPVLLRRGRRVALPSARGLRPGRRDGRGGGACGGAGGRVGPTGRVIGLDRDPEMLALAERATRGLPVTLVQASYSDLGEVLDDLGIDAVDGILLDLGLSSDQLAWAHRGFSFAADGPLDMRFDPEPDRPPPTWSIRWSEEELADCSLSTARSGTAAGSPGGSSRRGGSSRSRPRDASRRSSARASPASGARSTRPPASSRPCGSRSTTSSSTSTPPSPTWPTGSSPAAERPSSASTRWKTAG